MVCPITVHGRRLLAFNGFDSTVRLRDPDTGTIERVLKGHTVGMTAVCPITVHGGHLLASAGEDGTVRLWDVEAISKFERFLTGSAGVIFTACPITVQDRHLLATASLDGNTVRLWDPATGTVDGLGCRATVRPCGDHRTGYWPHGTVPDWWAGLC